MRPFRIGVIGSSEASGEALDLARTTGAAIARAEAVLICGGLGGVMEAAAEGARGEGGIVVGILPGTRAGDAAPGVTLPIATGLGEARNVIVARASEAVIAIGGEWGTLSEAALCRKFGVPLIGLHSNLPEGIVNEIADAPPAAVARAVERIQQLRGAGP